MAMPIDEYNEQNLGGGGQAIPTASDEIPTASAVDTLYNIAWSSVRTVQDPQYRSGNPQTQEQEVIFSIGKQKSVAEPSVLNLDEDRFDENYFLQKKRDVDRWLASDDLEYNGEQVSATVKKNQRDLNDEEGLLHQKAYMSNFMRIQSEEEREQEAEENFATLWRTSNAISFNNYQNEVDIDFYHLGGLANSYPEAFITLALKHEGIIEAITNRTPKDLIREYVLAEYWEIADLLLVRMRESQRRIIEDTGSSEVKVNKLIKYYNKLKSYLKKRKGKVGVD